MAELLEPSLLTSLLAVVAKRDFLVRNNGAQVPISDLEGKMVGLYFSLNHVSRCREFTGKLVEFYNNLKENGEAFEIVSIVYVEKEEDLMEKLGDMPWLALSCSFTTLSKLHKSVKLDEYPTLFIIGKDGKLLCSNVVEVIEELGDRAFPFSPDKFEEVAEIVKARDEAQTLELLLVHEELDFAIGKNGGKIPVSDLLGKTILLYFSRKECPQCCASLPKLIEVYHEIKAKDENFEIIFLSLDFNEGSFHEFYSSMPWLTLPYGDPRERFLNRRFKVMSLPSLVAIGPTGRTLAKNAGDLIKHHGSDAYPFTREHLVEKEADYEAQVEEMAKGWPEKVRLESHSNHELVLTRRDFYYCDECKEGGSDWSYLCGECDFDAHPRCSLVEKNESNGDSQKGVLVCDGNACYRV